jgi:uncharacterized membrane protein YGL010W
MSSVLQAQFADYAAFHQTPGNKACHYVGIPLIVFSIFALLSGVALGEVAGVRITLAEVVLAGATLYYFTLDAALAVMMLAVSIALDVAGRQVGLLPAAGLFIFGWILQFIGHYAYEGKSPAFFRNFTHLLVGPLWILAKATGRA